MMKLGTNIHGLLLFLQFKQSTILRVDCLNVKEKKKKMFCDKFVGISYPCTDMYLMQDFSNQHR